ncbi:MAG: hypothetical protein ACHQEM_07810, partial [Chitinophagales bacterium]
ILAAIAAIIYDRIYFFATEISYSKIVNISSLAGLNLLGCLIAAFGYSLFQKWFGRRGAIIFNLSFSILSFASIIVPISISLPLDQTNPELFPGLTVPMHFFPALAWYTLDPLFKDQDTNSTKN